MGLARYVVQRFITYLLVLYIGLTITFFLPRFMPSNPIDNYIAQMQSRVGQTMTPAAIANLRNSLEQLYGLKGSLWSQYLHYMGSVILHFDFGPSFANYPDSVASLIFTALPWTAGLLLTSTIIAWMLGNMVGLVAGYFNKSRAASILEFFGIVLYPIPYYILALVAILILAYYIPVFPLTPTFLPGAMTLPKLGNILYNSFLPGLTLVLAAFGWNILSMKTLAVATKEEPFVTYARMKGTSDWTRMTNYVFRNAMLPQVTGLVLSLATIFSGALLTEILFSYPGVGLLMRTAAGSGDYNMLYGTIDLSIIAVATAAFALDILYPLLDPRIRFR